MCNKKFDDKTLTDKAYTKHWQAKLSVGFFGKMLREKSEVDILISKIQALQILCCK